MFITRYHGCMVLTHLFLVTTLFIFTAKCDKTRTFSVSILYIFFKLLSYLRHTFIFNQNDKKFNSDKNSIYPRFTQLFGKKLIILKLKKKNKCLNHTPTNKINSDRTILYILYIMIYHF